MLLVILYKLKRLKQSQKMKNPNAKLLYKRHRMRCRRKNLDYGKLYQYKPKKQETKPTRKGSLLVEKSNLIKKLDFST